MVVAEIIQVLKQLPQDAEICIYDRDNDYSVVVDDIELSDDGLVKICKGYKTL